MSSFVNSSLLALGTVVAISPLFDRFAQAREFVFNQEPVCKDMIVYKQFGALHVLLFADGSGTLTGKMRPHGARGPKTDMVIVRDMSGNIVVKVDGCYSGDQKLSSAAKKAFAAAQKACAPIQ